MLLKILRTVDRYIVVILGLALFCGVLGQYMMSWDYLWAAGVDEAHVSSYAEPEGGKVVEPLEPLAAGLKVVSGYDKYSWRENEFHSVWQEAGYYVFELGRWLGFLVYLRTTLWLVQASLSVLRSERRTYRAIRRGVNVIAVHGASAYAATLAKNLIASGYVVSVSDKRILPLLGERAPREASPLPIALGAPVQVVMLDSDQEAFEFIERNASSIGEGAKVYVHLDNLVPTALPGSRLVPFSIATVSAQLYWTQHPIFLTRADAGGGAPPDPSALARGLSRPPAGGPRYRVVIVGDNDLTENILEIGLLTNVSDITGGIRYDVVGDVDAWRFTHPGLERAVGTNADELHFHRGPWYECRGLLLAADRVIE